MSRAFHHHDMGTPEPAWLLHDGWDAAYPLDIQVLMRDRDRLVVLAAHPDDETLGVGGAISMVGALGVPVTVVVATAGEASHPRAAAWRPETLAQQRQHEVEGAVHILSGAAQVVHLGLSDGGLAELQDEMAARLRSLLRQGDLVLAPWIHDGHADHEALGRAAQTAGAAVGAQLLFYPIWLWQWATPQEVDWSGLGVLDLTIAAVAAKQAALECFRSQTEPLGPTPGDQPVVGEPVLARARRLVEVLIPSDPADLPGTAREAPDSAAFDAMYDSGGDDPWGFDDSFYEQRKRALTLACLGRSEYRRGIEVGCATGQLTAALAGRVKAMTGVDLSERALAVARARSEQVTWLQGSAPDQLPEQEFDLIVLSEVGYFLPPGDWMATVRWARAHLTLSGELVAVHWQHPPTGIPLSGELVHRQAAAMLDLPLRASYRDDDVWIDVWGAPTSVALSDDGLGSA